jgi:hypothetical protein
MRNRHCKRVLIVEGYSDKRMFLGIQRHLGFNYPFEVIFPGDEGKHPGKASAISRFRLWLGEAAEPGRYEAIGLCVDADQAPQGGFPKTDSDIRAELNSAGFRMIDAQRRLYQHQQSGCLASFWIAPSHGGDGVVEALAVQALTDSESAFLQGEVVPFLDNLNEKRFDDANLARAQLYVYLGIQKKPDKSLPTLLDDGLIELTKPAFLKLTDWLRALYGSAS